MEKKYRGGIHYTCGEKNSQKLKNEKRRRPEKKRNEGGFKGIAKEKKLIEKFEENITGNVWDLLNPDKEPAAGFHEGTGGQKRGREKRKRKTDIMGNCRVIKRIF